MPNQAFLIIFLAS